MGLINNAIDSAVDALRFKDTIFYKENSDLQNKYDALKRLNVEYPNNKDLLNELYITKKGLYGENEIAYQLKKANVGMYVLRDIKIRFKDLTAQIDYVIITPVYIYYVECKNLIGNITVTDKGDFVREFTIKGKKSKKGMNSPLRQVEAQREVIRKIWESNSSAISKFFASKNFNYYRRVLVVAANHDTILDTSRAPKEIKHKILRADSLIRQIEYDINHRGNYECSNSKKAMEEIAKAYFKLSNSEDINYYEYFKKKYCNNNQTNDTLKERLIELRKAKSREMNIPAYYVFTNEELDRLVEIKPKTIDELKKANILTPIKIKIHGEAIINEILKQENKVSNY